MKLGFVRPAGRDSLIARPNGLQYGHLALEILMALAQARAQSATLAFLPSARTVSPVLFDLSPAGVVVRRPSAVRRAWWLCRWKASEWPEDLALRRGRLVEALCHEVDIELSRHIINHDLPQPLRSRLKTMKDGAARRGRRARPLESQGPYFRRRLIREPIPVSLAPYVRDEARRVAEKLGIAADARIVTIHAREAGFKRGMEVHEKHRRLAKSRMRDDEVRNARIDDYGAAVDLLLERGYTVVRIGDPSMTPFTRPGVIDLATSSHRTQALEVDCLLRSDFLVCGEAGPVGVSYLTNTPVLNVNATDPISSYPVRATGILLLKHVVDIETGEPLLPWEMLGADYLSRVRDTSRYSYADNTPDEIRAAVEEMLELRERGTPETQAQSEFRLRATEAAAGLQKISYVRKWGPDEGFLGDGRLSRVALAGSPS